MRCEVAVERAVLAPATLARALRHPVRRAVLSVVLDGPSPVRVERLAGAVETRTATAAGSDGNTVRSLRPALHHRHLPLLDAASLVDREPAGVVPGDHWLLAHPAVGPRRLLQDGTEWNALGAVFGQPRRRHAVAVLADADLPVRVVTLARAVAAERSLDYCPAAAAIDDLAIRLHHVDLPVLAEAGVVAYDAETRRVTTVSEPDLPVPIVGL